MLVAMNERALAIQVKQLYKTFRVPRHRVHTLKERALHPLRRTSFDQFEVLRNIDFDVMQGEFFGIVGRNGSGKSTLLKCLAGIYKPDAGRIRLAGRLSPFIELGVGFNPDLTARDNVVINAVMMGLTPSDARARFDEIIAFAELERFVDLKLKNYSSGMQVRLAFSVMVQSDADVMLIDEVLAVGDAMFQQKCLDVFYRLRSEGKTVVLVTHEMGLVERFCHRAMMINGGDITDIGDPAEIGRAYLTENFRAHESEDFQVAAGGAVEEPVRLIDAWVSTPAGDRVDALQHGDEMLLNVALEANTYVRQPGIAIWLSNDENVRIWSAGARERDGRALRPFEQGERIEFSTQIHNPLSAGRYYLNTSVTRGSAGLETLLYRERVADFLSYGAELHGLLAIYNDPTLRRSSDREPVT
jgi:ABC-type polysaccharide/polyol phosphate transport system ATPase subunit